MRRLACLLIFLLISQGAVMAQQYDRYKQRWLKNHPAIDSIVIEGAHFFSEDEIKDRMYAKTVGFWSALKGERRIKVQQETVGRDTLEIRYLYITNGFLSVQIDHEIEVLEPDSTALIRVQIHEGQRYYYESFLLTGDFPSETNGQFDKLLDKFHVGDPVNPVALTQVTYDLKTFLANRGYPYADVVFEVDTLGRSDRVPVIFSANADSLVHFGSVEIMGIQDFPQYVARRELKIDSGAIYRRKDIIESQRRLFESGYFTTLSLNRREETPDRLHPDFVLRVRERKAHFLSTELGVVGRSNLRDLVGITSAGVGKRNLFGSRRAELSADYLFSMGKGARFLENTYTARFTEPWLLGLRVPLTAELEWQPPLRDPIHNYRRRSWSATLETLFRFGDDIRIITGIQYQSLKITDFPEGQTIEGVDQTVSGRRKLYTDIRIDSRDNLFIPSRGQVTNIGVEYFGGFLGGDDNFYRLQAEWSTYQRVWPGWILAVRAKGGVAEPFGESDSLLTDDRLFTGGASSVRSFRENTLGPLNRLGNPIGGRYVGIGNVEFRWKTIQIFNKFPLIGSVMKRFPLWQSIFFDAGGTFPRWRDVAASNVALAYGTGVQILSPAGPIRLDYARRIRTDTYDIADRWHFTILYAF